MKELLKKNNRAKVIILCFAAVVPIIMVSCALVVQPLQTFLMKGNRYPLFPDQVSNDGISSELLRFDTGLHLNQNSDDDLAISPGGAAQSTSVTLTQESTSPIVSIESPVNVPYAGNFVARVNVYPLSNISASQFQITYDPEVVQVSTVNDIPVGSSGPDFMSTFSPPGVQGTLRIANWEAVDSSCLAKLGFNVVGSHGEGCNLAFTVTSRFSNSLFDSTSLQIG
jgi:hypothetical protein